MITRDKIQAIADKIAKEFQPEKIILFGSYAWGKPTEDSDVDLCIVKDVEDTRALRRNIDGAFGSRNFAMDVVVFRPRHMFRRLNMADAFFQQILTDGQTLYEQ